ncbi:MAG TPA: TlpA disulfide reductase family protein [bacterium]
MISKILVFASALALVSPALALNGKSLKVGHKAKDFTLKTFNGQTVSLSDHKGKVVLLDFWASWCTPCREEMPYLDILQKTYGGEGFTVLAINIDNQPKNALEFLKRYSIKLTPLWDDKKAVVSAYDVETMPSAVLIDQRGWIRFLQSGFKVEDFQKYKMEIEKLLKENRRKSTTQQAGEKLGL